MDKNQIIAFLNKPLHIVFIITILIGVIITVRTCTNNDVKVEGKDLTITRDTIITTQTLFKIIRDTIRVTPHLASIERDTIIKIDSVFKNQLSDKTKYEQLLREEYEKKLQTYVYHDRVKLRDSLGEIAINDKIRDNKIIEREVIPELHIPEKITTLTVTNTVTIKEKPKRNFYVGGEVSTHLPITGVKAVDVGAYYQDKKKTLYGAAYGYDFTTKKPFVEAKLYIPLSRK